jgi:hypothetical protein
MFPKIRSVPARRIRYAPGVIRPRSMLPCKLAPGRAHRSSENLKNSTDAWAGLGSQVGALAKLDSLLAASARRPADALDSRQPARPQRHLGVARPRSRLAALLRPIIDKLARKATQIMTNGCVRKIAARGSYPMTPSAAEFSAFMHKEADRWSKVLKELDLRYN